MRFAAFQNSKSRRTCAPGGLSSSPHRTHPSKNSPPLQPYCITAAVPFLAFPLHLEVELFHSRSCFPCALAASRLHTSDFFAPTEAAAHLKIPSRIDEAPTRCEQRIPTSSSAFTKAMAQSLVPHPVLFRTRPTVDSTEVRRRRTSGRASAADKSTLQAPRAASLHPCRRVDWRARHKCRSMQIVHAQSPPNGRVASLDA